MGNSSPSSNKWMWERAGYDTQEVIFYSKYGSSSGRWVIQGSVYGEWAEVGALESEPKPPESSSWLINLEEGAFYKHLMINCSRCEITPAPTPDPTEPSTPIPTSLSPTDQPTPVPSIYCRVLNVTDQTNGFYTGMFEVQPLPYNGKQR